jgi:hypothetical protein
MRSNALWSGFNRHIMYTSHYIVHSISTPVALRLHSTLAQTHCWVYLRICI